MAYPILIASTGTPIVFGPMILSSDHITATGDLHTTVTVTISKNGGAFGSPSGAISWIGNGYYAIAGNATDSGTAGPIIVHASVATNDPFEQTVAFVVDPTVALFGANVVNWLGTVVATPATAGIPDVNAKNINNATAVNGLTAAAIATGVWTDTTAGDFTTALSIGKSVMNGVSLGTGLTINGYTGNTPQTGDVFAQLPTHFSAMAIDASGNVSLSSATYNAAADALLARNIAGGSSSGRLVKEALYVLRNKVDTGAGIVYQVDDATTAWTFAVTTTAGNPITVIDPA